MSYKFVSLTYMRKFLDNAQEVAISNTYPKANQTTGADCVGQKINPTTLNDKKAQWIPYLLKFGQIIIEWSFKAFVKKALVNTPLICIQIVFCCHKKILKSC